MTNLPFPTERRSAKARTAKRQVRTAGMLAAVSIGCVLCGGAMSARAQVGYTVDDSAGTLDTLNFATGQETLIGPLLAPDFVFSLAFSPNGTLYGLADQFGDDNGERFLYTIDPTTGTETEVANITDSTPHFFSNISFDGSTAILTDSNSVNTSFFSLNTTTGSTTLLSTAPTGAFTDAMTDLDATDALIISRQSPDADLEEIGIDTGSISVIGDTGVPSDVAPPFFGSITGIDFADNGDLYGVDLNGDMYQFDTTTGEATDLFDLGNTPGNARFTGLAFSASAPEPGSFALALLPGIAIVLRRRGRLAPCRVRV